MFRFRGTAMTGSLVCDKAIWRALDVANAILPPNRVGLPICARHEGQVGRVVKHWLTGDALRVEAELDDTPAGRFAADLIREGLTGLSVGYVVHTTTTVHPGKSYYINRQRYVAPHGLQLVEPIVFELSLCEQAADQRCRVYWFADDERDSHDLAAAAPTRTATPEPTRSARLGVPTIDNAMNRFSAGPGRRVALPRSQHRYICVIQKPD